MARKFKNSKFTQIVNDELSEKIEKKDKEYVKIHKQTANKLSILNYENLSSLISITNFIGTLVSDYQKLIDFCNSQINGALHTLKEKIHIKDINEAKSNLDRMIIKAGDEVRKLKAYISESGNLLRTEVRRYFQILLVLYFITGVELLANFEIFSTLGGGLISNLSIATLTAIIIFWYAHFTPAKVVKYGGSNVRIQLLVFIGFFIPIVIVFFVFSSLRIKYLVAMNPDLEGIYNSSPFIFTLLNAFAYLISFWIVKEFKPDKKTILEYKKYRNDQRKIKGLESDIEKYHQEIISLDAQLREKQADRYNMLLLGEQTEQEIVTRMESCFEQFKLELYLKTSGECSKLFTGDKDKDLPRLKLNYENIEDQIPKL